MEGKKINKIIVASPLYHELERLITDKANEKRFRFMPPQMLKQEDINWADALLAFSLDGEFDLSSLKWVHSLGAGVDKFLYKRHFPEEVVLTRTICSFGQRIAEYCLGYLLRELQFHQAFGKAEEQEIWKPITPKLLSSQKVMVYGTGEIGQKVGEVLALFGVKVYGVSRSGRPKPGFVSVRKVQEHHALLPDMDCLINTMPFTKETAGMLDKHIFSRLQNAGFINVGRGASVNDADLLAAVESGTIAYAVLDVFAVEPLPKNHPFWSHPSITVTPHISAVTTAEGAAACFLETLERLEAGKPLANKVDPALDF